jgi:hypothetical protein
MVNGDMVHGPDWKGPVHPVVDLPSIEDKGWRTTLFYSEGLV